MVTPPYSLSLYPNITGLAFNGSDLTTAANFTADLSNITVPLVGYVRITDNTTSCKDRSVNGDCSSYIPYTLDFVRFDSPCPGDVLLFSREQQVQASWSIPTLIDSQKKAVAIASSANANTLFPTGNATGVSYIPQSGFDPTQNSSTTVDCSFQVCIYVLVCMGEHTHRIGPMGQSYRRLL